MRIRLIAGLLFAGACAAARDTTGPGDAIHDSEFVNGNVRLHLSDFPTAGGVMFVAPAVTGGVGGFAVTSTQYGSLCALAVTGRSETQGSAVALHVTFRDTNAKCGDDFRALNYDAFVSQPPGTYSVTVIHEFGGMVHTMRVATATVQ